jgi:hypothetical protein
MEQSAGGRGGGRKKRKWIPTDWEVDWRDWQVWKRKRSGLEEGIPRRILLNDPVGNEASAFERNSVSTGKYNIVTFLPIFLVGWSSLALLPPSAKCDSLNVFHSPSRQSNSAKPPTSSSSSPPASCKSPAFPRPTDTPPSSLSPSSSSPPP